MCVPVTEMDFHRRALDRRTFRTTASIVLRSSLQSPRVLRRPANSSPRQTTSVHLGRLLPSSRHTQAMALIAARRIYTKVEFRINPALYGQDRRTDHEILGVPKGADEKQIQKAYSNMLRKYYPWQYGVQSDSEVTEQYIQKKVAYMQLIDQEKTWHKRLRHRFSKFYQYIVSALFAIGFYEALRYLARDLYKKHVVANRLIVDERKKIMMSKTQ
uniref:J domain-containing protein n=1 Tax=Steinernema glaseri TaxID=37863 RepID=A0A1I8A0L0_9BILA